VQYKNLVEEEDMSKLLIETVSADEVRPVPLRIKFGSGLSMFDKVDAFDNDGWWVGKVTGQRGPLFFVFYETTGDEIAYHVSRLRIHLDWVNGKWVSSKKYSFLNHLLSFFLDKETLLLLISVTASKIEDLFRRSSR
jgi:hypothetical protein